MKFAISLVLIFQVFLCAHEYVLPLGDLGSVHYVYDEHILLHINRLSSAGELMYTHSYNYDVNGQLISENLIGDLGELVYEGQGTVKSPYHLEVCEYDVSQNLIRHTQDEIVRKYYYNDRNELVSEYPRILRI